MVEPTPGDPSGLVAYVTVSPTSFRAGESVQIEVGIRNPTKSTVEVGFTSGCEILYVVTDSHSIAVAPDILCTANAPIRRIAPGETISKQFTWDGTGLSGPLPPGTYKVSSSGFLSPVATPVMVRILAP